MSVYSTLICSLWWYSSNWHWDCDSGCSDSPWEIEADYRADKTELRFASNQRRMEWLPSQGLGRGYPLTLRFTTCDTGNSIILQKRCGRQPPKWICWIVTFNNKYVKIIYFFLYWWLQRIAFFTIFASNLINDVWKYCKKEIPIILKFSQALRWILSWAVLLIASISLSMVM